jgi:K+-sensing histidine kinase KdpD
LVLLDIRMPGMDGYEVCRRLKAVDTLREIPVVFISAHSATEDIITGFGCGGVDYIAKPFREQEVLARVRTHIALRRAYADLAAKHEKLRTLEHYRDALVHMLVNDLRNPLQVILLRLESAGESGRTTMTDDQLESLQAAVDCARFLDRMISTVVDLSRMEEGRLPFQARRVAVREVFRTARMQSVGSACRSSISERIDDACPPLWCDGEVSARILANLIASALKRSAGGGIVLGAAPSDGAVRIWVRDHGAGISPEHHRCIFEKFGMAGQPFCKGVSPSGLGLAFCKLAVEAQGGTIGVESEPDKGNTFWFTLPAAAASTPGTLPE